MGLPNQTVCFTGNKPHPQGLSKNLINITKDTFGHFEFLGNSKSLGSCKPGTVKEDHIHIRNVFWPSEGPKLYFSYKLKGCKEL